MRRALFGNTGYGLDTLGTEETVTKLRAADLKAFHQKLVVPNNCVLAIFGDVKAERSQSRRRKSLCELESRAVAEIIKLQTSERQHAS